MGQHLITLENKEKCFEMHKSMVKLDVSQAPEKKSASATVKFVSEIHPSLAFYFIYGFKAVSQL